MSRSLISVHPGDDGYACVIRQIALPNDAEKVQVLTPKGSWKTIPNTEDALIPRNCFHAVVEGKMSAQLDGDGEILSPVKTLILQIEQKLTALKRIVDPR